MDHIVHIELGADLNCGIPVRIVFQPGANFVIRNDIDFLGCQLIGKSTGDDVIDIVKLVLQLVLCETNNRDPNVFVGHALVSFLLKQWLNLRRTANQVSEQQKIIATRCCKKHQSNQTDLRDEAEDNASARFTTEQRES